MVIARSRSAIPAVMAAMKQRHPDLPSCDLESLARLAIGAWQLGPVSQCDARRAHDERPSSARLRTAVQTMNAKF